jgi:hypothetical protein
MHCLSFPNKCSFKRVLFIFQSIITDAPTDGEGGIEDENRSVSGFLHFDTATKGKAL